MEKILCVIGLMACLFAISVLSLKAAKSLAKDNNHPFSQMLLGVVYYITAFVSAPVGIFAMLYAKQEKEAYKAEAAELDFRAREITNKQIKQMEEELASEARAREMKDRKIEQLEDEISSLHDQIVVAEFDSFNEGINSGEHTGFLAGYMSGFDESLRFMGCSDDQRKAGLEHARNGAKCAWDIRENMLAEELGLPE